MQPDTFGRETAAAQAVARRVGMKLIQEKKEEVLKAASDGASSADALKSRDLLTLLIKANMSEDVPEDRRLSDEDVLARECPMVVLYDLANIMHRGPNVGKHQNEKDSAY